MRRSNLQLRIFQWARIEMGHYRTSKIARFLKVERGLTITEYAVAAGLIAASLTATFQTFGLTIDAVILSVIAFM